MPDGQELWETEEALWTGDVGTFSEIVADDCVMAFPGIGLMGRSDAIEGIAAAPRWARLTMRDRRIARSAADTLAVLGYLAEAQRDGDPPYRAFCTTTYCAGPDGWRLVQHQQTQAQ